MILDSFQCAAKNLLHPCLRGQPIRFRREGDTDDASSWHPVKAISNEGFREDLDHPFVRAITVAFHDGTPDIILNEDDQVEFAVPRPPGATESK